MGMTDETNELDAAKKMIAHLEAELADIEAYYNDPLNVVVTLTQQQYDELHTLYSLNSAAFGEDDYWLDPPDFMEAIDDFFSNTIDVAIDMAIDDFENRDDIRNGLREQKIALSA